MKILQKIAVLYLIAVIFFILGIGAVEYDSSPYLKLKKKYLEYAKGHDLEKKTSAIEKLKNDIDHKPYRWLHGYPLLARKDAKNLEIEGLTERRELPFVYMNPNHAQGYRAIFGALDFEENFWGGVLLGPDGTVLHAWKLTTSHLPTSTANDLNKNLYGLHLFPDGSVIFLQQEDGGGIVKVDACSNVVWNLPGNFHHTITPTEDNTAFWTLMGMQADFDHKLTKVSVETGKVLQIIDMRKVRERNPYTHIFHLQRQSYVADTTHGNDIDPLPSALADRFEQFEAGDLLLSHRTQNLVLILDPDTMMIKWWRIGNWGRQHDPDWEADGKITVFSNNDRTRRRYSDIISIDPKTYEAKIIVDGEKYKFRTAINGQHESTPYGTRMIASTNQGWVFEVDSAGDIVFSFVNNYNTKQQKALNVSEAIRVAPSYFKEEFWKQCKQ